MEVELPTAGLDAPLLLPAGVFEPLGIGDFPSSDPLEGCSWSAAKDDSVAGEAIGFATSSDCGLVFGENEGIAKVRASAAKEGKDDEDAGETGNCVGEFSKVSGPAPGAALVVRSSFAGGDGAEGDSVLGGGG